MVPVLEAVPNFSAGRDPAFIDRLIDVASKAGAEVLDASADADHNRVVLTMIGAPDDVENATMDAARIAVASIDLRVHRGAHPRIGALDVLPFVPLHGLTMEDARASARRVGRRLATELGVPVYFYGHASDPPGRHLADLRRGGFEALVTGFPEGRTPDLLPDWWSHPGVHPSAGATCVGARPLLLAWNVEIADIEPADLRRMAAELRERDGGFPGLRALGLVLGRANRMQISMNLEEVRNRKPFEVFRAIERRVDRLGGRVVSTEVIGMIPDNLLQEAGADRLKLSDPNPQRVITSRLADHIVRRMADEVDAFRTIAQAFEDDLPREVREAVERLGQSLRGSTSRGDRA